MKFFNFSKFKFPFLIFLFLFLPSLVWAQIPILSDILGVVKELLFYAFFFALLIIGSEIFVEISGSLLDWIINPNLISLSYTNPAGNPLISAGLTVTQSFVNLALVVVLVIVALSIALGIKEYGSQRVFARLLIVALFVNFAPVVIGLLVDGANLIMYWFLTETGLSEGISDALSDVWQMGAVLLNALKDMFTLDFSGLAQGLAEVLTQIILNFALGVAFLLFALIFLVRYIAIWVLVILAPLAFVAWILPGTRKRLWDFWLNQLIQWTFIGIPLAFFLYLSMATFDVLKEAFSLKIGHSPLDLGFFDRILPYFVLLIFLYLGFVIGLKTSALGASWASRWSQAVPTKAWQGTKEVARYLRKRMERRLKAVERAEKAGRWLTKISPLWGGLVGKRLISYAKRRREEEKKELEGLPLTVQAVLKRESISEIVRGLTSREFVQKAKAQDLKNIEVFFAMSLSQLKILGERGSPEQKETLLKTYLTHQKRVVQEKASLKKAGKIRELEELRKKEEYIAHHPNFIF
jgi:hypothetical protein